MRLVYPMEDAGHALLQPARATSSSAWRSPGCSGSRSRTRSAAPRCCGQRDYERIAANRAYFGDFDPFGDFDLLFGAAKLNLQDRRPADPLPRAHLRHHEHPALAARLAAAADGRRSPRGGSSSSDGNRDSCAGSSRGPRRAAFPSTIRPRRWRAAGSFRRNRFCGRSTSSGTRRCSRRCRLPAAASSSSALARLPGGPASRTAHLGDRSPGRACRSSPTPSACRFASDACAPSS